jgi:AraC family transcriptional regulator of adaptative response/methylated-DNA-[protein]-cysteine methyltransferase
MTESVKLTPSQDYHRIAQAIAFIRQNHLEQPDLATIAQHIGLSESYFQRLFSQWAGISPKRFLQYLTVEYAKSKILQSQNLLDLTWDVGLSSPGRLHDLFVKLEALSPGEFKSGGAGIEIRYGIHETPFGKSLLATTTRGICNLYFLDAATEAIAPQLLAQCWQQATLIYEPTTTQALNDQIFYSHPDAPIQPISLLVKGTNFQVQVWRALLQIPLGGMTTYQAIAKLIARPTAARAVGNAVGSNPIAYLIPCHRVIRESGELGGYHWGLERKSALLGWEASRVHDGDRLNNPSYSPVPRV